MVFPQKFRYLTIGFQKITIEPIPEPRQAGNTFGFTVWHGSPTLMTAPHAHNDVEVNICSGELVYTSAGRITVIPAGTPCAFWGAKPHQLIHVQPGARFAFATVPLAQFTSWSVREPLGEGLLHGRLLLGEPLDDTDARRLLDRFEQWGADLARPRPLLHRAVELELQGLILRMVEGTWTETLPASGRASRDLDRASQMAAFIAENATADIRLADVARAIHLHENRASSLFRQVFGSSVTDYLGQFRVAEAQRLLLTTDLTSAAVAASAGFQSLSSYHETFVRVCGTTPTRWRDGHRRAPTGSSLSPA